MVFAPMDGPQQAASDSFCDRGTEFDDRLGSVLNGLLAGVRRHCETPLLEGFDSRGVVEAALHGLFDAPSDAQWQWLRNPEDITAAFEVRLEWALLKEGPDKGSEPGWHGRVPAGSSDGPTVMSREEFQEATCRCLTEWLERFHETMLAVHPRAIEIASRRVEGYTNRQAAERLGMTFRLTRRIVQDILLAWHEASFRS